MLGKAVMQNNTRDSIDDVDNLDALLPGNVRRFGEFHRQQEHALVERVIVPQEIRQGQRHAVSRGT